MQSAADIELVLGRDWRDDVRYLSDLRPYRPADSVLNLVEIYDIVDFVVDGNNLTAPITEESVFGFLGQLMEGLWSMSIGRNRKAIVEFHREPWELCVVADDEDVLVSLYSVDRRQRVVAHDVRVGAASLIGSTVRAAEELLGDLFAISESFSADPFVRRFSNMLGKLRRVHAVRFPDGPVTDSTTTELHGSTSAADGLTFSYLVDASYQPLHDYAGEHAFDQHALLAAGVIEVETPDMTLVRVQGYPLLIVRSMLERARELLTLLESTTTQFRCDSELHQLRLDVATNNNAWTVDLAPELNDSPTTFEVRPDAFLDAILTITEMIVNDVGQINEHLQLNQRLVDLREEVVELRNWHDDFSDANHYLEHPEQFLIEHGDLRPASEADDDASFPFPLGDVRALYPRRGWTLRAPRINFSAIAATPDSLFVPTQDELLAVDRRTGDVMWRHGSSEDGATLTTYAVAADRVVAADDARRLHFFDCGTGERVAASQAELGSLIVNATSYERGNLFVVADFDGGLVGVEANGDVRWRFDATNGLISGMACSGPIICALTSPGFVHGINPATGALLWRVRLGGLADAGPYFHQGRVFTFSHDSRTRQLTIHAMFPFTGRTAWQLRLEGTLVGRPDFIGDYLIAPIERHGRVSLVAIDTEAPLPAAEWRLEVLSAGVDQPTRVVGVEIEDRTHGLVRTDTGEITCFDVQDGEVRWRIEHRGPSDLLFRNLDLIVVRDAVLSVGARLQLRNITDGALLHEFGEVMVAPEFVSVGSDLRIVLGERGADHGDDDSLVAWSTQHFLAVV